MRAIGQRRKPPYAGLRHWYWIPETETHVGLYDGEPAEMDTEGGRWQTVCEEHGSICSHETLEIARSFARCPVEWCEDCMDKWGEPSDYELQYVRAGNHDSQGGDR